ncbi:YrhC-like protein [Bacillus sp. OV322]|uniref:YrhC family protein n=1 Tax=unclassified Bacillus (in: firmicutes) TaxID=185979 RepID=UPI0008E9EC06|nr:MULTISPECIES: YrhC family protein [unclassified Bacillus (in: firmicutes)]OIK13297.1 hypothetical protein BIV59_05935 [Bacillus sp. MUM 13]SFC37019.1 YrhC-like protein [Bacillus sp. OV322]
MNTKEQTKVLMAKMHDFKRFAMILLCVGSFFYIGTILPDQNMTMANTYAYMITSTASLLVSVFFFMKAKTYKRHLDEIG